MSHDRDSRYEGAQTPLEREALDALLSLRPPEARAGARDRAREAFLAASDAGGAAEAASKRRAAAKLPYRYLLPFAAVLALLAAFSALYGTQPSERWRVTDVIGADGVHFEGQASVGAVVAGGVITTSDSSEVELQLGDEMRCRIVPGSRVVLPEPPGRWFDRARELEVVTGEVYGTTGGRALSFPLRFFTPELSARLVGTTFAVFRTELGSCVCLYDGGIEVTPEVNGVPVELPEEHRYYVYKDGRLSLEPIDARERMKLNMMYEGGVPEPEPTTEEE